MIEHAFPFVQRVRAKVRVHTRDALETSLVLPRLWCLPALKILGGKKCLDRKLSTVNRMSSVVLVIRAMPCPMPPWNVNKTALFQREHRGHIFLFFHWTWMCWFQREGKISTRGTPDVLSQRNRCTIWFWVRHPGFGSSSSTQLIKAQTIKSEDVKDKRVAFRCHKILFKTTLSHSVLTFTFPFWCMEKRTIL